MADMAGYLDPAYRDARYSSMELGPGSHVLYAMADDVWYRTWILENTEATSV